MLRLVVDNTKKSADKPKETTRPRPIEKMDDHTRKVMEATIRHARSLPW